jgi:hypothetical protein
MATYDAFISYSHARGVLTWDAVAGDFDWNALPPLPPATRGRFSHEPRWIDLRPFHVGADARNSAFMDAGGDFAATIHGLPKEVLLSQEVHQQRRALRLAWSAVAALVLLFCAATWQWWLARTENLETLRAQSRLLAGVSNRLSQSGDQVAAALVALEALPEPTNKGSRPVVVEI